MGRNNREVPIPIRSLFPNKQSVRLDTTLLALDATHVEKRNQRRTCHGSFHYERPYRIRISRMRCLIDTDPTSLQCVQFATRYRVTMYHIVRRLNPINLQRDGHRSCESPSAFRNGY